ncbi:MAG TPA: pectate lyase [Steroidobacteraceae bacterium]|nr:pectate lyase [Steroidobacteraceae bacterium]
MKYVHVLLALGAIAAAGSASAANRPSGWTTICKQNETCTVAANTNVAFGRADQFYYKVLSGTFSCTQATFGGIISGGVNECSTGSGTPPPTNPPPTNPPPATPPPLGAYPGCEMPLNTLTVQLSATQVVPAGTVFDGQNKVYNLSGGNNTEGQPPVFLVKEGGTVRNVIIGPLAADGIHCEGNCTLNRVWWQDVGEDAATALGPAGTVMNISCGAAQSASDKTFQFNGRGEMRISNFYVANVGKLVRTCGDCTGNGGPRKIFVTNVIARDVTSTIVGINSNYGDVATIRGLTLNNSGTSKTKICQVFKGVVKGSGSSTALGVEFNTPACQVSQADVTLMPPSQMNTSACAGSCPIP